VGAVGGWLWVGAEIIDFSIKGVRLRTPLAWEAGQTRRIRFVAGPVRLEVEATCVWVRTEGGWGARRRVVGAAFQGVTAAEERLLAELLAQHGVEPTAQAA